MPVCFRHCNHPYYTLVLSFASLLPHEAVLTCCLCLSLCFTPAPVQSCVELLLCQLAAVQDTAFELNGSQGEPFELEEHLLPHEAPDDHAMSCN